MKGRLIILALLVSGFVTGPARAVCEVEGAIQIDAASVPFVVPASGKYMVVDNLVAATGTVIQIPATVEDVYLCLQGFQLTTDISSVAIVAENTGTLVVRDGALHGGSGIRADGPQNVVVQGIQASGVFGGGDGVAIIDADMISVRDCLVRCTGGVPGQGIRVSGSVLRTEGKVRDNEIQMCTAGIELTEVKSLDLSGNQVTDIVGPSAVGIGFADAEGCLVAENTVTSVVAGRGIEMEDSDGCTLTNNLVRDVNGVGIFLGPASTDNLVEGNVVSDCIEGLEVRGNLNQIAGNVLNSNTCFGLVYREDGGSIPIYNVHRGNTARGNDGTDPACDPCGAICSADFCAEGFNFNTSQGDNFLPCVVPASCTSCER